MFSGKISAQHKLFTKWIQTEIMLTLIDRARRDASDGPGPVKYGQHMDEIERNYKIEEVKSDPSGICSDRKMISKIEFLNKKLA